MKGDASEGPLEPDCGPALAPLPGEPLPAGDEGRADLAHARDLLAVLLDCHRAFLHVREESVLLREVCRSIVQRGGYPLAWVGLVDPEVPWLVWPVGHVGAEPGYQRGAGIGWTQPEPQEGPSATVVRTGEPALVADVPGDAACAPTRERSGHPGYAAVLRLPLRGDGGTFGLLAIHASEVGFRRGDAESFGQLARDISFAIEQQRGRADDGCRRSEAQDGPSQEELTLHNMLLNTDQETSLDGILVVDPRGELISFNRRFLEVWAVPDDVAATRSVDAWRRHAALATVDPGGFLARNADLYAHPEERSREEIELRDGRTLDRYSSPMLGPDGCYHGRVWYFRDITERKRSEQAVQEERRLFAGGPTVVFRCKAEPGWPLEYVSPNSVSQFGYEPADLRGTRFADLVQADDLVRIKREIRAHLQAGVRSFELEYRMWHADGRLRRVSDYTVLLADARGRITHARGYLLDITERWQATEALRAANQRLQDIIEFLPDATFVIDDQKRVIAWNRATEEMTGVAKEDILGRGDHAYALAWYGQRRPIAIDLTDGALDQAAGLYRHLSRAGQRVLAEVHLPSAYGGRGADVLITASPLLDGEGRRVGAIESVRDISDRIATETALRAAEAKYRGLFENALEGIFQSTPSGELVAANPALARLFGFESVKQLLLSTPSTLYADPDDRRQWVDRACRHGGARAEEIEVVRKDGSRAYVSGSAIALRDEAGRLLGFEGYVVDVTERRRVELALAESEERYRRLYEDSPSMYFTLDQQGTVLSANQYGASQFGYAPADLVGRKVTDLFVPEERARELERFRTLFAAPHQPGRWEARRVCGDGRVVWVAETVRVVGTAGGTLVALVVGQDITERKAAETRNTALQAQLAAAAAEWSDTFDAVGSALVVADALGNVRRVNAAVGAAIGASPATAIGRPVGALGPGEPWRTAARLCALAAGSAPARAEDVRDDAGRAWNVVAVQGVPGAGPVIALHDVTELIKLQEAMRQRETMVALGSLVAGVAHEVRNPLFAISSLLDALEASHGNAVAPAEFLRRLRREGDRLNTLVSALFEYGRPLGGGRSLVPLGPIVAEAIQMSEETAKAGTVTLVAMVPSDLPLARLDRRRMLAAFRNLIENAIQHSPRGGRVIVSARQLEGASPVWLEVAVKDEGPGFGVAERQRALEPFYSERRGAVGLGLAIVDQIVQAHGGRVGVGNAPAGGGLVTVQVPA